MSVIDWMIVGGLAGAALAVRPLCNWRIRVAETRCAQRCAEATARFDAKVAAIKGTT